MDSQEMYTFKIKRITTDCVLLTQFSPKQNLICLYLKYPNPISLCWVRYLEIHGRFLEIGLISLYTCKYALCKFILCLHKFINFIQTKTL